MKTPRGKAIDKLMFDEGWSQDKAMNFVDCVYEYLDCRGYFIGDIDGHPGSSGEPRRSLDLDFGRILMDMTAQYNMENFNRDIYEKIG